MDPLLPGFDPPTFVLLGERANHYATNCKHAPLFVYTKLDPNTLYIRCKQMLHVLILSFIWKFDIEIIWISTC